MENIMPVDRPTTGDVYYLDQDVEAERLRRKEKLFKRKDKAKRKQLLEERKTMINPDAWDKIVLIARVCYMHDKDADLYDVFETYRTKMLGGWESTPEQLQKLDQIIEQEELKSALAGA